MGATRGLHGVPVNLRVYQDISDVRGISRGYKIISRVQERVRDV